MGCKGSSPYFLHIKNEHGKLSLLCDPAVELAQRPCRAVSRIRKRFPAKEFLRLIYRVKIL